MMRVGILTKRFSPECCGVGDCAMRLAETWQAHGTEVVVFSQPASGPRPDGIRVVETRLRGWRDILAIARVIEAERLDKLQIEYSGYSWGRWGFAFWVNALFALLRIRGVSITVAFHETAIRMRQHPKQIPISLLQWIHVLLLMWTANEVLTNTAERMRILRRLLPGAAHKLRYRPNGSNIPERTMRREQRDQIRASHGAGPDALVVATFGNFASAKNYEAVLKAVANLRSQVRIKLWLLGEWENAQPQYIEKLRELIRKNKMEVDVDWSGRLPASQISELLSAADLFVLPQADGHLTRSGAFMAAAAHGLPVIAVRNQENQLEFVHGVSVWLVAESNASEFEKAIKSLFDDSPKRSSMGRQLQALYAKHFDWVNLIAPGGTIPAGQEDKFPAPVPVPAMERPEEVRPR